MTPDALNRFIREAATALDLDPSSIPQTEEGLSDLLTRLAAERDSALYEASAAKGRATDLAADLIKMADARLYKAKEGWLAEQVDASTPSARAIADECNAVREMLLKKNAAYGDSALAPVRIFSKASPVEQILVRLDDKISRLARGSAAGEDVVLDLIGYLILLRIAQRREREEMIRASTEVCP